MGLERALSARVWPAELARLRAENARLHAVIRDMARLKDLVFRDALTGLRNRRYFEERMAEEIEHARIHGNGGCLVLLDLDDFKQINDRLGHLAGDEALRATAALIEENVRLEDAVCRIGGDEFAVIMSQGDETDAGFLAARLQSKFEQSRAVPGVSIGAAAWGPDTDDLRSLIDRADQAMYEQKAARKAAKAA